MPRPTLPASIRRLARGGDDTHLRDLDALLEKQGYDPFVTGKCLAVIAGQTGMRGDFENHEAIDWHQEHLERCKKACEILLAHGANPLHFVDRIMLNSHMGFINSLVDLLTRPPAAILRLPDGQNLLHLVAAGAHSQAMEWNGQRVQWPDGWTRAGRQEDGATPLHLAWAARNGAVDQLVANMRVDPGHWEHGEMFQLIIETSGHLLATGATWDDLDGRGVRAGQRMAQALARLGIHDEEDFWTLAPNDARVAWFLPETLREMALVRRGALDDGTARANGESRRGRI